jgi:hypothetical protein
MSNVELADTRLSFDDLLEAVQDSKRGRWFLQEFESRVQKRDTQSILSAISKLENRMEILGPKASSPDDLTKVRSAISNARDDLFKLGLGKDAMSKDGMSKEGRLFAEMAEMARKAVPQSGDQNAGIVRTLQLVDEIDRAISSSNQDTGSKFFAADSNLFDRPPASKPVLVEVTSEPTVAVEAPTPVVEAVKPAAPKTVEPVATGAKLTIRKIGASTPNEAAVVESILVAEAAVPTSELPKSTVEAPDNPRIVIIRRRAEDMPEVAVG